MEALSLLHGRFPSPKRRLLEGWRGGVCLRNEEMPVGGEQGGAGRTTLLVTRSAQCLAPGTACDSCLWLPMSHAVPSACACATAGWQSGEAHTGPLQDASAESWVPGSAVTMVTPSPAPKAARTQELGFIATSQATVCSNTHLCDCPILQVRNPTRVSPAVAKDCARFEGRERMAAGSLQS